jgi:hypothetical protein
MKIIISNINSFDEWKDRTKDSQYLRPIFLLHEYLKKNISDELLGFYIHGSLASLDYIKGYSDFDAVMIINDEISSRTLKNKLRRINNFPYLIDILQHHGITILKSSELLRYNRIDFPFFLFEKTLALGNSKLRLEIETAGIDYKQAFEDFYKFFRGNFNGKNRSPLELKAFLSIIQLFPAIYLQAKNNKFIGKKESFEEARKDFKKEWGVIDIASKVRNEWNYSPIFPDIIQNILLEIPNLERVMWFLGKFVLPVPRRIRIMLGDNYSQRSFELIELMRNNLQKNE